MGGDGRGRDAADDSWTDVEEARPDMVEAVPVRHGMVLGGRYAIDKIIGRGGSGVVVRAHDRDLRQVVAIKIVRAELAGQRVWAERLAREVRLARQIQHPHVCRVFDFQQADARVFLVMELAENGTLRDELRSGALAARPLAERIADARAVASALAAIHGAGIVHRDLTPQNMLRMGDGRLVLSDFGLATDASENTSVHGGTIAYMAPEVLRGGHSSFASDIWALGAVMHEIVFGVKPLWSDGAVPEILAPKVGRKLTEEERAVLEACRACTAKEPARRIASAAEAGRMLTERRRWRARLRAASRRPVIVAAAVTVVAAVAAVGGWRARAKAPVAPSTTAEQSPLIVPTGEAADWTDASKVLLEVPDRIQCTRLLPDQRTIRFVWGAPPRAEDVDTVTQKRSPSPIVPAAYAEGCPDLSPDGQRLIFQGRAKDGRTFVFLSASPDGKDATPVVPTAEPSMQSEPTWLGDGHSFSYDVDARHVGIFSTGTNRISMLPEVTPKPYVTSFRYVVVDQVLMSRVFETGETEYVGTLPPAMTETLRFRVSEFGLDLRSAGSRLYYTNPSSAKMGELVELDVSRNLGNRLGRIRDQFIRYPSFPSSGVAFVSIRPKSTLTARGSDGSIAWTADDWIDSAGRCGRDIVVSRRRADHLIIERVDSRGRFIARLTNGMWDTEPVCSPDGEVMFYIQSKGRASIMRCDRTGCRGIADRVVAHLAISGDGRRLAFVTLDQGGPGVEVMDLGTGGIRRLAETGSTCQLGWASAETLWISRRRDGKIVWTEINAESGHETGRSIPGSRDCSDGWPDPQSPVLQDPRIDLSQTSQLRLLGKEHLNRQ